MTAVNKLTSEFTSPAAAEGFVRYFREFEIEVFNYAYLDSNIQALYEVPQKTAYLFLQEFCKNIGDPGRFDKCVVEFIDVPHYQAYAATDGEYHFIALSLSLPILTQTLFQNLINSTNPFSEDGAKEDELYLFPTSLESRSSMKEKVKEEIESLLIDTMPPEKWQKVLSTKLAELAVVFCVAHEISHLVRGHAELNHSKNLAPLAEVRSENQKKNKLSNRLSQAWEVQADRTAIAFLYSYVMNNDHYRKRLLKSLGCNKSNPAAIELMSRSMYALSFVLFLFGQEQQDVKSTNTHPSAITRQTHIMAHIISMLSSEAIGCDENETETAIKNAATQAEKAWNRAGFEFGSYSERIDDLPDVVKSLTRADYLCNNFLSRYHWAGFIR